LQASYTVSEAYAGDRLEIVLDQGMHEKWLPWTQPRLPVTRI
jgi:hypothetical protein